MLTKDQQASLKKLLLEKAEAVVGFSRLPKLSPALPSGIPCPDDRLPSKDELDGQLDLMLDGLMLTAVAVHRMFEANLNAIIQTFIQERTEEIGDAKLEQLRLCLTAYARQSIPNPDDIVRVLKLLQEMESK